MSNETSGYFYSSRSEKIARMRAESASPEDIVREVVDVHRTKIKKRNGNGISSTINVKERTLLIQYQQGRQYTLDFDSQGRLRRKQS